MNSDDERRLKWWLRHYKNAGRDLARLVEKVLEDAPHAKAMLKAQLPAYIDLFEMTLFGGEDDGKQG